MNKKKIMAITMSLILGAGLLLSGCGKNNASTNDSTSGEKAAVENTIKVAMVTDIAGVNDQAFNQSCWEGLKKFENDSSVDAKYVESHQESDYQSNIDTLIDSKNDLIWGVGFKMADTLKEAAIANPEQKFGITDISYGEDTPNNVVCVTFKAEESGFLIGYIAGKMTETNNIGFIGGMDVPVVNQWKYGYIAGVKYANPDANVEVQYAESFTDAAKGKAMGKKMYMDGKDIVFAAAGNVTDGVIESAKEQQKWVICGDMDQSSKAPDNVLICGIKAFDVAVYDITNKLKEGEFESGTTKTYGLAEGGTGIAPKDGKNVTKEVLEEEKQVEQKIIDGEIKIPTTQEELDNFIAELAK